MGQFNGFLQAEFTPPQTWVLSRELSFQSEDLTKEEIETLQSISIQCTTAGEIKVPATFKTDLASVPRSLWAFLSPWDVARAAVIHDQLYLACAIYYLSEGMDKRIWKKARKIADKVFSLAMDSAAPPVPKWKKKAAYYSVRLFGKKAASVLDDRKLQNIAQISTGSEKL